MTQEKFRKVLDDKGYYYKIEGNKIVVIHKGTVELNSLTSIPLDMVFNNEGNVWLDSLASIPPSVEFKNRGHVNLESLIGDWFYSWKGNIEGIKPNRLLNKMISLGLFER